MFKENPQKQKKPPLSDYGKYLSLAFQMGIIIALGVWCGIKLDGWLGLKKIPIFTLILSLFSVGGSIYLLARSSRK